MSALNIKRSILILSVFSMLSLQVQAQQQCKISDLESRLYNLNRDYKAAVDEVLLKSGRRVVYCGPFLKPTDRQRECAYDSYVSKDGTRYLRPGENMKGIWRVLAVFASMVLAVPVPAAGFALMGAATLIPSSNDFQSSLQIPKRSEMVDQREIVNLPGFSDEEKLEILKAAEKADRLEAEIGLIATFMSCARSGLDIETYGADYRECPLSQLRALIESAPQVYKSVSGPELMQVMTQLKSAQWKVSCDSGEKLWSEYVTQFRKQLLNQQQQDTSRVFAGPGKIPVDVNFNEMNWSNITPKENRKVGWYNADLTIEGTDRRESKDRNMGVSIERKARIPIKIQWQQRGLDMLGIALGNGGGDLALSTPRRSARVRLNTDIIQKNQAVSFEAIFGRYQGTYRGAALAIIGGSNLNVKNPNGLYLSGGEAFMPPFPETIGLGLGVRALTVTVDVAPALQDSDLIDLEYTKAIYELVRSGPVGKNHTQKWTEKISFGDFKKQTFKKREE